MYVASPHLFSFHKSLSLAPQPAVAVLSFTCTSTSSLAPGASHPPPIHLNHSDTDHTAPVKALPPSEEYYQRVRSVHEEGGYGSIGYRAPFSREESEKLLLRTHTTAVSTDMLYRLANQEGGFKPAKFFSIDRVFRYVWFAMTSFAAMGVRVERCI